MYGFDAREETNTMLIIQKKKTETVKKNNRICTEQTKTSLFTTITKLKIKRLFHVTLVKTTEHSNLVYK